MKEVSSQKKEMHSLKEETNMSKERNTATHCSKDTIATSQK